MIQYKCGDVLKVPSGLVVHQANAIGVFGSGIAKQIKDQFPKAYMAYKEQEKTIGLTLGTISYAEVGDQKWIVNLVGQQRTGPGLQTSYKALEEGFYRSLTLYKIIQQKTDQRLEICMPRIGCGLGGGDWNKVEVIIKRVFHDDIPVSVYDLPSGK